MFAENSEDFTPFREENISVLEEVIMEIKDLDTPALLIDEDIMTANLHRMAKLCQKLRIKLRPHIKTHKICEIALRQVRLSGNGIAVSKLGEAEVMSSCGITDIVIANQLIGKQKIERLNRLINEVDISICVDSRAGIDQLEKYLSMGEKRLGLYIEIDTGMRRCGLSGKDEVFELAKRINASEKLYFKGILSHSGNIYQSQDISEVRETALGEIRRMAEIARFLRQKGIKAGEVSVGSTPAVVSLPQAEGITEFRPGNYVFNDYIQISLGVAGLKDCALSILATVISRPAKNRAVIDAGSKSLGLDKGVHGSQLVKGHGLIKEYPEAVIERLSEEHGIIRIAENSLMTIGERITIIPNHACPVVNLFEEANIISEGRVFDIRKIDARGKSR